MHVCVCVCVLEYCLILYGKPNTIIIHPSIHAYLVQHRVAGIVCLLKHRDVHVTPCAVRPLGWVLVLES